MEDDDCWLQLEDYRLYLIKTIEPSRITPYLRQCKVLSSEDEEQIFNDPNLVLRSRRVGTLLDILQRTGVKGHVAFLESLELDYPQLYRKITGNEPARAFSMLVDTVGESGLTQFLMSEVTRLQNSLANERRRRQEASAAAAGIEDAARQQQLRERELQTQQERLQRLREERDRLLEELRHMRNDNYSLMLQVTKLSEEKNCALMDGRDLQLEIEKLKHKLLKAESDFQILRRRTVTQRNIMEQWSGRNNLKQIQNQNHVLSDSLLELEAQGNTSGLSDQSPNSVENLKDQGRDGVVEDQKAEDQKQSPVKGQRWSWESQEEKGRLEEQKRAQSAEDQRLVSPSTGGLEEQPQRAGGLEEQTQWDGGLEGKGLRINGGQQQLSCIYSLKRELHETQEQRDRFCDEKEVLELKCTTLKKDAKMYRQRMKDILKQLEEVMGERNKALTAREECHQENCRNLLEKDQYRRQIRELGERCDELQAQLFRREGEVLALETRVHRHSINHDGSQTTSEEDCREKFIKKSNFNYRRKRAVRAKGISKDLAPHNIDDSSGSDNTDWEGM